MMSSYKFNQPMNQSIIKWLQNPFKIQFRAIPDNVRLRMAGITATLYFLYKNPTLKQ